MARSDEDITTGQDQFAPLAVAARAAEAYRRHIATAERTPIADYAAMMAAFDAPLPEQGGNGPSIIAELAERATPGLRAMTGPRFYGWVIGQSHPTGVAADWLTAAWGQNTGNVVAAPAACAVEAVAARWLLELLGLPAGSGVGVVTGATVANFVCLCAARNELLRRAGWDVEADGMFGAPPITVLVGADAHSTVFSALRYAGFGARRVVTLATDASGRILATEAERALGRVDGSALLLLQAGQINTGACDPFAELIPLAHASGAWVHVDGAFGLWAQAAPQRRHLTAGVDAADSWAVDGHKWLQTPYDCGFAIVRDEAAHRRAMEISASYLPPSGAAERDPTAYVPELSRRARGFAAWAMIRQLGRAGIADLVERCCRIAARMGEELGRDDGVALVAPVELNQFMLRFGEDDATTLAVVAQVQADAVAFIGSARWRGAWVMRVSVTSGATTEADADLTIAAVRSAYATVRAKAV
jgi:glutamate/tyrosine decarboxylase-like PLP-dependent enzyme